MKKYNVITFVFLFFVFPGLQAQETGLFRDSLFMKTEYQEDVDFCFPEIVDKKIDSLYACWHIKGFDPNCNRSDECVDFTSEEYINRLSQLPTVMEMNYNSIVQSYIDMYAKKRRKQVEYMLGIGYYYFPLFEQILDAEGLPVELKYLPVIESALNPNAVSRVGACGLWQFMYGTGKIYGLESNSLVDERRDPVKSTYAAAKFLKDLYEIYNDWNLVIAAYNCGPGNVNKAIRRSGGKKDYWSIYYFLPKETRGYVPAFIAANYVMNYYADHNLCPIEVEMPIMADTIQVFKDLHLEQVASVLELPIETLRAMNPQYKTDLIPGSIKPYDLRLPYNYTTTFIDMQDSVFNYKADDLVNVKRPTVSPSSSYSAGNVSGKDKIYYKIKSGDNLGAIASKYRVSVSELRQWNNLRSNTIQAGKTLVIYTNKPSGSTSVAVSSEVKKTNDGKYYLYKVRSGDNLWTIARKFGVGYELVRSINNMSDVKLLQIGQTLKIPAK